MKANLFFFKRNWRTKSLPKSIVLWKNVSIFHNFVWLSWKPVKHALTSARDYLNDCSRAYVVIAGALPIYIDTGMSMPNAHPSSQQRSLGLFYSCATDYPIFQIDAQEFMVALKFGRRLGNIAAEPSAKFHTYIITSCIRNTWWRHQMETFFALLATCAGKSPVTGEFPAQRPVTRSFDVFFDLRLNKRLSKQW